eukprot:1242471-Amphidinium_carterae.1
MTRPVDDLPPPEQTTLRVNRGLAELEFVSHLADSPLCNVSPYAKIAHHILHLTAQTALLITVWQDLRL